MNELKIKGNWNILKGKVKHTWGELTDDEISQVDGEIDKLIGLIQEKYGKTQEAAHNEVDKFFEDIEQTIGKE